MKQKASKVVFRICRRKFTDVVRPPSIFNDVLGPVMRGPSSSHMAAALRIGRVARNLMNDDLQFVKVEYDPNGALVTTHDGHGSDMGLFGGVLGFEAHDARLKDFKGELSRAGKEVDTQYVSYDAAHPSTYKLTLWNKNKSEMKEMLAISTGGGMIEIQEIEGAKVQMFGDFYETLIYLKPEIDVNNVKEIAQNFCEDSHVSQTAKGETLVNIKSSKALPEDLILKIRELSLDVRILSPVMPILASKSVEVPFITIGEMLTFNEEKELSFPELAIAFESMRGGLSDSEVFEKMREIVHVMRNSVDTGLKGTDYNDRILPCQSVNFVKAMNSGGLIAGDIINKIISYVTAIMECKSGMETFVAAPTAGSCGACPGTVLAVADFLDKSEDEVVRAMFIAGMIGVFVQHKATFSAEVGGCMAECGTGSGMATAAIVYLAGGSLQQSIAACSMALQNSFGMTCDPIANRVEAPCLGKNIMAATNALSCANMSLAGYQHLIPLDEVLDAMNQVAGMIPHELKCTGKAGLATTPTALKIEESLGGATIASRLGCGRKTPC